MSDADGDWMNRFWTKVDRSSESSSCWIWRASTGRPGKSEYGRFKLGGKTEMAHRLSWQIAFGPIHSGLQVLHVCDNPRCVNPNHLFLGTRSDNMRDMVSKGRDKWRNHREER